MKFETIKANVDKSLLASGYIGDNLAVDMVKADVFANVLVEGDVNLYSSLESGGTRYYLKEKNKDIAEQLLYKKHIENGVYKHLYDYRLQIHEAMPCTAIRNRNYLTKVKYTREDMIALFRKYNSECSQGGVSTAKEFTNESGKRTKIHFAAYVEGSQNAFEYNMGRLNATSSSIGFGAGIEAELLFAKDKWAAFGQLGFSKVDGNAETMDNGRNEFIFDGTILNLNLGPRYYINLGDKSRLFINAGVNLGLPVNKNIEYIYTANSGGQAVNAFNLRMSSAFFGGIGYQYNNKFVIGLNILSGRNFITADNTDLMLMKTSNVQLKYFFN